MLFMASSASNSYLERPSLRRSILVRSDIPLHRSKIGRRTIPKHEQALVKGKAVIQYYILGKSGCSVGKGIHGRTGSIGAEPRRCADGGTFVGSNTISDAIYLTTDGVSSGLRALSARCLRGVEVFSSWKHS
jgi:hypothetical protein